MVVKKDELFFFYVTLQVLVACLQFYFRVEVSCKVAFEERTCKIFVNKIVILSLLNLKLDFNKLIGLNRTDTADSVIRVNLLTESLLTQETLWASHFLVDIKLFVEEK